MNSVLLFLQKKIQRYIFIYVLVCVSNISARIQNAAFFGVNKLLMWEALFILEFKFFAFEFLLFLVLEMFSTFMDYDFN